jgi:pantoate kinase
MANRDEVLANFLNNPKISEFCELSNEDLRKLSFSSPTTDPLLEALRRLIISVVEKGETSISSIKAVNTILKNKRN